MHISLIGLGAMGTGMARNFAKAGYLLQIWNRTTSKADSLATELNVQVAPSLQELALQAEVILICVSADDDLLEVIYQLLGTIKPNTIVIDCSTVSSNTAKTAAQLLDSKQAHFLDAPVSGGVEGANNGNLAMMVGGNEKILEQVTPLLEAISSRIIYMGKTGSGQGTKAVNQIMAAGINQAVTEALAFAQAEGLPLDKVIDVVSGGAAGNWFLSHRGVTMTQGHFEPGFKLALHHKDLRICQSMAEINSTELSLVNKTVNDYQQLMDSGFSNEDISALYRLKLKALS